MLAGTVTNRQVYTRRETSFLKDPEAIGKCPFALMRAQFEPKDVIVMIRDPAYIVTSIHSDFPGYMMGWTEAESSAKRALQRNWDAMKPYLAPKRGRGAFVVRYEDLIENPNEIQRDLKDAFGLEYNGKEFSHWPDGFSVEPYWLSPLGEPRKLRARNSLNPEARQRVASISAKYPYFNECRRVLGYDA